MNKFLNNHRVVVLSFNHPDLTSRTVESVRTHVEDANILLVHNGSDLKNYEILKKAFPHVEHLFMEKNLGFAGGANQGLKRAFELSAWAIFITNDCKLLSLPQLTPEPSFVTPLIYFRKVDRIDSVGGLFNPLTGSLKHSKTFADYQKAFTAKILYPYHPGTAFALHRDVFRALGGFDESLHTYWEDVDFSVRAIKANLPLAYDSQFKLLHLGGKTCHKKAEYTTYYFQRNRKKVSLRHCPTSLKPFLYLALSASWARQSLRHLKARKWDNLKLLVKSIWT